MRQLRVGCWLALLVSAGCGRQEAALQPVRGRVLYQGKPVPNAFVVFHPVGTGQERPVAQADARGDFQLCTRSTGDGAPVGDYVVTVEWRPLVRKTPDSLEPGPNRLPARYGKRETSELRVRIDSGAAELPPLQLKP